MSEVDFLRNFNKSSRNSKFHSKKYELFLPYIDSYCSGEGMIGDNSYLILWEKDEIEELNDAYEVTEFLNDCILIGSDGGDTAYGINSKGIFFSVPFIGMCNEEIKYLGNSFSKFLEIVYNF